RRPFEVLLQIADLIVNDPNPEHLLQQLSLRIFNLTDCEFLNFSIYDSAQNCMQTHYWNKGQEAAEFDAFSVEECYSGWVWQHHQAVVVADTEKETRFPECIQSLRRRGLRSYGVFPMNAPPHNFGALGLGW